MAFLSKKLSHRAHEQSDKLQQALKYITSAIQNIETVKCFNGEAYELSRYMGAITRAGHLYKRQARFRSAQIGVMQFYTISIFFQGFWYGSYLVTSGKDNPGNVVTTFWTSLMAVQAVTEFLPQFIILQKGKVAAARLRSVMVQIGRADHCVRDTGGHRPDNCVGDIHLCHVSFSYPTRPNDTALHEATIFFPAGETTFIVGRSGSGKSTLGQLLVRFYNPTGGYILIDDFPLAALDTRWVRENITLVEQHSVLFRDTIARNIAMAKQNGHVGKEEVEQAAHFALLQQMIQDLPDGLDTLVGTKGNSMSGGQRQRVALARARLRDSPILILDESTSALDHVTRKAIIEAIRVWRRGKTTIIITHDITQILPDDYVYILDKARLVQEGYRKTLEAEEDSHFQTFLNTSDPEGEQSNSEQYADEETDQLWSLYEEYANMNPYRQPPRELRFRDSFFSPTFMTPGRSTFHRQEEKRMSHAFMDLDSRPGTPNPLEAYVRRPPTPCEKPGSGSGRSSPMSFEMFPLGPGNRNSWREPPASRRVSRTSYASQRPGSRPASPFQTLPQRQELKPPPKYRSKFIRRMRKRRSRQAKESSDISEPTDTNTTPLSILSILATFYPRIPWSSRLSLFLAILCALVHAAATPVFGFVFARLLSTFYAGSHQYSLALTYALSILAIAITDGLAVYGFQYLFDACAQTWANSLKAEAMRRILLQPREFFDREENSVARLAECLDNFGEEARNLPGRFVGITTVVVAMIAIAVVWCMVSCWKLTLVALATGPVLYAILSAYNAISSRWETRANSADEEVGSVFYETFVNIRTVRSLCLEATFQTKFLQQTKAALKTGFKRAIYTGSIFGLNYSGVFFVSTLCFWYGAFLLSKGEFGTTRIMQTFTILLLSCTHATFVINYIPQINIARDAGSRLLRLATLPIEGNHELKGTRQVQKVEDIAFKGLDFAYPTRPDTKVLRDLSFSIEKGSCTAIVGASGSGKSTIASLLLKLYAVPSRSATGAPAEGGRGLQSRALTVSGVDISSLHTASLRTRIAIVPQSTTIFPSSIVGNIVYGLPASSPLRSLDNIRQAARAAGIAEFIESLPQGYNTLVGEGGTGLSGGQAQRVGIARAVVRRPDVLVLDEATSALDVESAGVVRGTVRRLVRGEADGNGDEEGQYSGGRGKRKERGVQGGANVGKMTVIIITHAREMMAIADKIIVLEQGAVVEEGGFEELKRRRRGAFARLLRGGDLV
jgi:ATP-binding cassette subfamily B (MDR/TAP) protein 1